MRQKIEYNIINKTPLVEELIKLESRNLSFNKSSNVFEKWLNTFKECLFDGSVQRVDKAMFANGFGESLEDDLKSDKVDELNKRIEEIGLELDKLLDDENYDRAEFDKLACIQADMIRERESLKR